MVNILDKIRISNIEAVVNKVYENGTVEVVYKDGNKHIYKNAKIIDGEWEFVNPSPFGGYADGKRNYEDAIQKLDW